MIYKKKLTIRIFLVFQRSIFTQRKIMKNAIYNIYFWDAQLNLICKYMNIIIYLYIRLYFFRARLSKMFSKPDTHQNLSSFQVQSQLSSQKQTKITFLKQVLKPIQEQFPLNFANKNILLYQGKQILKMNKKDQSYDQVIRKRLRKCIIYNLPNKQLRQQNKSQTAWKFVCFYLYNIIETPKPLFNFQDVLEILENAGQAKRFIQQIIKKQRSKWTIKENSNPLYEQDKKYFFEELKKFITATLQHIKFLVYISECYNQIKKSIKYGNKCKLSFLEIIKELDESIKQKITPKKQMNEKFKQISQQLQYFCQYSKEKIIKDVKDIKCSQIQIKFIDCFVQEKLKKINKQIQQFIEEKCKNTSQKEQTLQKQKQKPKLNSENNEKTKKKKQKEFSINKSQNRPEIKQNQKTFQTIISSNRVILQQSSFPILYDYRVIQQPGVFQSSQVKKDMLEQTQEQYNVKKQKQLMISWDILRIRKQFNQNFLFLLKKFKLFKEKQYKARKNILIFKLQYKLKLPLQMFSFTFSKQSNDEDRKNCCIFLQSILQRANQMTQQAELETQQFKVILKRSAKQIFKEIFRADRSLRRLSRSQSNSK